MCNCRRRRYGCLYNACQNDSNSSYETLCNNVPNNSNSSNDSCNCGFDDDNIFPEYPMFAQSYVPFQTMTETYTPCTGLSKGTIFPELFSEYFPGLSMAEIQYIADTNTIGEGCNG